jgi:hypothetical protein
LSMIGHDCTRGRTISWNCFVPSDSLIVSLGLLPPVGGLGFDP